MVIHVRAPGVVYQFKRNIVNWNRKLCAFHHPSKDMFHAVPDAFQFHHSIYETVAYPAQTDKASGLTVTQLVGIQAHYYK